MKPITQIDNAVMARITAIAVSNKFIVFSRGRCHFASAPHLHSESAYAVSHRDRTL
jgi:hypothetical protein